MINVLELAAESKITALFHNCQEAAVIHHALLEMKYPQYLTPIKTDN